MLFISILLSVWFAIWLMKSFFVRDTLQLIASWISNMYDEEYPDTGDYNDENAYYRLTCDSCDYSWLSSDSSNKFCPNCGKELQK